MVEIEQHKKQCQDGMNNHKYLMLSKVLSELTIIRKMLEDYMKEDSSNIESPSSLFKNASPKLRELMKILSSINRIDNCLVFVNNQTTATFLFHYIQVFFKLKNMCVFKLFIDLFNRIICVYMAKQI